MHKLNQYQSAIYDAHFDNKMLEAARLIVPYGLSGSQRLNIYRNNTFITLTEALSMTFPVVNKLVSDDFFAFMAGEFIKDNPPLQGPLFEYGDHFADFLDQFKPVASLPYLMDVAELEWAINFAYHAGEATPLQARDLSHIAEDDVAELRFELHPSLCIITSKFPIDQIWHGNQAGGTLDEIDLTVGTDILVIRPAETVNLHSVNPGTSSFLTSLMNGEKLEQAYTSAISIDSEFDAAKSMVTLLAMGVFVAIQHEKTY